MAARRLLLATGVLGILLSASPTAFAQAPEKVYRLGMLSPSSGTIEELPALARELAARHPGVVMATGGLAIRAARQASDTIPIVGSFIGEDPIKADFATSLAHPGGMITGIVRLAPGELLIENPPISLVRLR